MKAVILCGGLGSRLSEYTKDCPKPLLKVNQLSIIEWQIISLKKVGVTEILINLHYLAEQVIEYLKDGKHLGVKIKYIFQEKLNGTGGAALGFNLAYTNTYNIYKPTNTNPGNKAPKNISPALVEDTLKSPGILKSPVNSL